MNPGPTVPTARLSTQGECMSYEQVGSLDDAFRSTVVTIDVDGSAHKSLHHPRTGTSSLLKTTMVW